MAASRRLQLAAEEFGTIGLPLRRWRRRADAADFEQPTAATTRWRVSVLPFTPLPVPGIGRVRWGANWFAAPATFEVEACDAKGGLELPPDLAYRPSRVVWARAWMNLPRPLALTYTRWPASRRLAPNPTSRLDHSDQDNFILTNQMKYGYS
jgi:hypothetical protein